VKSGAGVPGWRIGFVGIGVLSLDLADCRRGVFPA
jgi:hypothetical protein